MSSKQQWDLFYRVHGVKGCASFAPIVARISKSEASALVEREHYARGMHNGPMAWGGFAKNSQLRAVCAYATPCSEAVRRSIFGEGHEDRVVELHRLCVERPHPKNYTSWFVRRTLDLLLQERPCTRAVISFADPTEGHTGAIYRALNFKYLGVSARRRFFRDPDGRLRHPRQNGVNLTLEQASCLGWVPEWREGKHRYLTILGEDRRERRRWEQALLLDEIEWSGTSS